MKKVVAVSYLNTRPFIDGITRGMEASEYELETMTPSDCGRAFLAGAADVALAPAAILLDPRFDGEMQTRFCIGAMGKVDSVYLFSDVPVEKIQTLILDADSMTSNRLAQILARHHWKIHPNILPPGAPVKGSGCGAVSIGDKAVPLKDKFAHAYDLAHEWANFTARNHNHGSPLPFVFAVWVHKNVESSWLERWYAALDDGVKHAADSARRWAVSYGMTPEKAEYYLTRSIDYRYDDLKASALSLFLDLCRVKV